MRKWLGLLPAIIIIGFAVVLPAVPTLFGKSDGNISGGNIAGTRATLQPISLPVDLPTATGYTAEDAFPVSGAEGLSFSSPVDVIAPPGETDRLFVVCKTGTIEVVTDLDGKNGGPKTSVFLDVKSLLEQRGQNLGQDVEWGVLGLAFHPNYAKNGYFYVSYSPVVQENGESVGFDRVARFSVSKTDRNVADPASEMVMITQLDRSPSHDGGCLHFGDDGYLYTTFGDEGNPVDHFDNARWVDKHFFAAILRIDVDRRPQNLEPNPHHQDSSTYPSAVSPGSYKVPADNPLIGITSYLGLPVDPKKVRTEMYATGLRNPWRFSFDPPTGRMFAADVGQEHYEEVDLITKGGNYGWSYREGLHDGPRMAEMPAGVTLQDPIYEYSHSWLGGEFNGNCIIGGFVYRGTRFAELTGAYIFGDYLSRKIWALRENAGRWTATTLASNVRNASFEPDPRNGDILIVDYDGGRIQRLVRKGVTGTPPPPLLSQVGAFKNLKSLEPAQGLVPYEPNVTFWSDYAIKQRWFMVSNSADTIGFHPTNNWTFPAGMVWVKHFEIETTRGDKTTRRRLETRLLVKTAAGVYGITYKWRPDNSDADLVSEAGDNEVLDINDGGTLKKQTWHYPSQSECLTCHTQVAGGALGFNTWQLNGNGGGSQNQIEMLEKSGYFAPGTSVPAVSTLGALAKADDTSATVEWRARSYLAANCVQCHQPGGVAQGAWDARPTTATDAAGLINGVVLNNRGDSAAKVFVPGDQAHSLLLRRIEGRDAPRMPPLATSQRDPNAERLLRQWIAAMKK